MKVSRRLLPAAAVVAAAAAAAPAQAADLLSTRVAAADAAKRTCSAKLVTDADSVVRRSVTVGEASLLRATLTGASGDWDLAAFDARGRRIAGSAAFGTDELAEGFAAPGRYTIQACRRTGSGSPRLAVKSFALPQASGRRATVKLVRVSVANDLQKAALQQSGLDLTEHGGDGFLDVVTYGDRDEQKLRKLGLTFTVVIADATQRAFENAKKDAIFARSRKASALPSGREGYRTLDDYQSDMKSLAEKHPDLVKPLVLPHKSLEGRQIAGIEITRDVQAKDGKPVFLNMGVHHAREWPSGEHAMEWAFELVNGKDPRVPRILDSIRTIVVPIVNVDGFALSRAAQVDLQALAAIDPYASPATVAAADLDQPGFTAALLADQTVGFFAYKRRNCRVEDGKTPAEGACGDRENRNLGVDPNRNYGGFWGGGGASTDRADDTYRGAAPFSEPETQNIRSIVSTRQVATLITNHTFSNLVLRPPGIKAEGATPDEAVYKQLGDAMAKQNGYASQFSYQLYDTTGTTEDWSYYNTGGLGFTFEIGPDEFHPPFEDVVAEYEGTAEAAKGGGGNREAYFIAAQSTADTARHGVVTGHTEPGTKLRVSKTFGSWTSAIVTPAGLLGVPATLPETVGSDMVVGRGGAFEWHVNPSQRPYAEKERKLASLDPKPTKTIPMQPAATSRVPAATSDDFPFEITAADKGKVVRVAIDVPDNSDYDLVVYRGTPDDEEPEQVGSSGGFLGADERVILNDLPPGKYYAHVDNYAGFESYSGAIDFFVPSVITTVPAAVEHWTLSCERGGRVVSTRQLDVDRGQRVDVGDPCGRAASAPAGTQPAAADGSGASLGGSVKRGLRYTVTLQRRNLRTALRKGLRGRATCSVACTLDVTLKRGKVTVGRAKLARAFSGRRAFTLRFTKRGVRSLRRSRTAKLAVVATARDVALNRRQTSRGRLRLVR